MTGAPTPTADSFLIQPESWTRPLPLEAYYPHAAPLHVDLGCGKGRFLTARAARRPELRFLGIDRLLVRLRKIDRRLRREGLSNVRLLRIEASYAVRYLLPPGAVSVFYILFPDPWPKRRHHRRRLFNPAFLDALEGALCPGGQVHVATDHGGYHEEIVRLFGEDARFEPAPRFEPEPDEETDFERIFKRQGAEIGRCSYRTIARPGPRAADRPHNP